MILTAKNGNYFLMLFLKLSLFHGEGAMANLDFIEKDLIDNLFNSGGYVLNFTNRTFQAFVHEKIQGQAPVTDTKSRCHPGASSGYS